VAPGDRAPQEHSRRGPTLVATVEYLAYSLIHLGRLQARAKRFSEAFTAFDTALGMLRKDGGPRTIALGHAYRGGASVGVGQPALAAADLRLALELLDKRPPVYFDDRFERGRVPALLAGLGKDLKSGVTPAEAAAFADRSIPALRDAFANGWNLADELKEPDFDAIRDRADFKTLVTELEKKKELKK
jgi:hypothetical protein